MQRAEQIVYEKMILALVQQFLMFIVLYNIYSENQFFDYKEENGNTPQLYQNTSLAIFYNRWTLRSEFLIDIIIDGRFKVGKTLGSEGFTGFVRSGIDLETGDEVAIKFATENMHYSLEKEFVNYLYLGADNPDVIKYGIPQIFYFGKFGGYTVLVMTKAGPTLQELQNATRKGKFNINTICKIAMQAMRIFEYIHSKGLLFHDVKPTNIAIGNINENQIIFFDFAFSEFHINALGEPKQREDSDEINGTPEYMARGPLHRLTHVRKDDLISFGLVMLELNGVILPWKEKINLEYDIYVLMDIILETWDNHTIEKICEQSENPTLFLKYFYYFDGLESHEEPDYENLVELFAKELTTEELDDENLGIFNDDYEE